LILGIETSGPTASLALWENEELFTVVGSEKPYSHAESLNMLLEIVTEAFPGSRVSLVALSVGPGLFTSLRAGASMAKALGMSWGVPVRGVGTLEALAVESGPGVVACALDARKGEVYGAVYALKGETVTEVVPTGIYDPGEMRELASRAGASLFSGSGARAFGMAPFSGLDGPSAKTIARLGAGGKSLDIMRFEPLYLRKPDAVVGGVS